MSDDTEPFCSIVAAMESHENYVRYIVDALSRKNIKMDRAILSPTFEDGGRFGCVLHFHENDLAVREILDGALQQFPGYSAVWVEHGPLVVFPVDFMRRMGDILST